MSTVKMYRRIMFEKWLDVGLKIFLCISLIFGVRNVVQFISLEKEVYTNEKRLIVEKEMVIHTLENINNNTLHANGLVLYIYQPKRNATYKEMTAAVFDEHTPNILKRKRSLFEEKDIVLNIQNVGYSVLDSTECGQMAVIYPIIQDEIIIGEIWALYKDSVPEIIPTVSKECDIISAVID